MNSKFSRSVEWMPAGNAVKVPVVDRSVRTSAPYIRTSAHQDVYV